MSLIDVMNEGISVPGLPAVLVLRYPGLVKDPGPGRERQLAAGDCGGSGLFNRRTDGGMQKNRGRGEPLLSLAAIGATAVVAPAVGTGANGVRPGLFAVFGTDFIQLNPNRRKGSGSNGPR